MESHIAKENDLLQPAFDDSFETGEVQALLTDLRRATA